MAVPLVDNELWRMAAREGVSSLIELMDQAEADGTISKPENFAALLNIGLARLGVTAKDLSSEEDIGKSSISRWVSGEAVPPSPTRKHVIGWIKQKAAQRLLELKK